MSLPGYRFSSDSTKNHTERNQVFTRKHFSSFSHSPTYLCSKDTRKREALERKRQLSQQQQQHQQQQHHSFHSCFGFFWQFSVSFCSIVCVSSKKNKPFSLVVCTSVRLTLCSASIGWSSSSPPPSLGPCVVVSLWMSNCGAPTVVETRLFRLLSEWSKLQNWNTVKQQFSVLALGSSHDVKEIKRVFSPSAATHWKREIQTWRCRGGGFVSPQSCLVSHTHLLLYLNLCFQLIVYCVCLCLILGASQAVDLHLEGQADSVFFFQQSFGSSQQPLLKFPPVHSPSNGNISSSAPESRPLLRERLALISQSGQQGRIRVTYGPFEAKQSLPTKFLSLVDQQDNNNSSSSTGSSDIQATLMDISAHVVNGDQGLRRESPVLRVLFHSGRHFHSLSPGAATGDRDETGDDETAEDTDEGEREDQEEERDAETWDENLHESSRLMETCISLRVYNPSGVGSALTATCTPRGLEGVCLASLTLPYDWWASSPISPTFPSLSPGVLVHNLQQQPASVTAKPTKALRNLVELSYSVYQTKAGQCDEENRSSSSVAGQPVPPDSRGHHQLGRLKNPLRHQQTKRPRALPSSRFPPPSAILIQSARSIGSLRLLPNVYAPRDLLVHEEAVSLSPTLRFIASAAPLYPHSRFYVTVLLDTTGSSRDEPYAVVVR